MQQRRAARPARLTTKGRIATVTIRMSATVHARSRDSPAPADHASVEAVTVATVNADGAVTLRDLVAIEEPMEIRIGFGPADQRVTRTLCVTMRTPGHDFELAAGFVFAEGIITGREQLRVVRYCTSGGSPQSTKNNGGRGTSALNVVRVELEPGVTPHLAMAQRNFIATSSCGVCGKASLEAIELRIPDRPEADRPSLTATTVLQLRHALRAAQPVFAATGALHGAALFTEDGALLGGFEDVGRHNAVDKLIGDRLLRDRLPVGDVMMVSGRTSFEVVQKAAMAQIPILIGIGAPSSLAISLARRCDMTLVGFVREERFNLYSGHERILCE